MSKTSKTIDKNKHSKRNTGEISETTDKQKHSEKIPKKIIKQLILIDIFWFFVYVCFITDFQNIKLNKRFIQYLSCYYIASTIAIDVFLIICFKIFKSEINRMSMKTNEEKSIKQIKQKNLKKPTQQQKRPKQETRFAVFFRKISKQANKQKH